MNPTVKYKKGLIKMFYISVRKDIENWTSSSDLKNFFSPYLNGYSFNIDINNNKLYIHYNDVYTEICRFAYFRVPFNLKMYFFILKLIFHFKNIEKYKKYENETNTLKCALTNIQETYKKEIRKEKLENLK